MYISSTVPTIAYRTATLLAERLGEERSQLAGPYPRGFINKGNSPLEKYLRISHPPSGAVSLYREPKETKLVRKLTESAERLLGLRKVVRSH